MLACASKAVFAVYGGFFVLVLGAHDIFGHCGLAAIGLQPGNRLVVVREEAALPVLVVVV